MWTLRPASSTKFQGDSFGYSQTDWEGHIRNFLRGCTNLNRDTNERTYSSLDSREKIGMGLEGTGKVPREESTSAKIR